MNNIVMVLSNPFISDPRVYRESNALIKNGFNVTIYAWDRECKYPLYELKDGIIIKRIRVKSSFGYESPFIVFLTLPIFLILALTRILQEKIEVIHCHDFDTLILGILIKWIKKIPLVFDAHEYYPSLIKIKMPKIIWRIIVVLHEVLPRKSDAIIIVNDYFKRFFKGNRNIITIVNAPFKIISNKFERKEKNSVFKIFYYGGLSHDRILLDLISSIAKLPRVELIFAGKGELREAIVTLSKKYRNINYLGWITEDEILNIASSSDLFPILYDPVIINNRWAAPNKLFLAMAMGIPIIAYKETLIAKIIKDEKCGISVSYGDFKEIKKAIMTLKGDKTLCRELSKNGIKAFNKKYSWEKMEKRLINLYKELALKHYT